MRKCRHIPFCREGPSRLEVNTADALGIKSNLVHRGAQANGGAGPKELSPSWFQKQVAHPVGGNGDSRIAPGGEETPSERRDEHRGRDHGQVVPEEEPSEGAPDESSRGLRLPAVREPFIGLRASFNPSETSCTTCSGMREFTSSAKLMKRESKPCSRAFHER